MIHENSTKEEVLKAVKQYGLALKYASDELRGDREVVMAAVKQDGLALKYASDELRGDREVVLAAVWQDAYALSCASDEVIAEMGRCLAEHMAKYPEREIIEEMVRCWEYSMEYDDQDDATDHADLFSWR
jgi:hypothetical protein